MALHGRVKVAGRTFTAQCGHKVNKGEQYGVTIDYWAYGRYYKSFCMKCWNGGLSESEQMAVEA